MKTILVDAINGLILEDGTIFKKMHELLETYPNNKLVLSGANDKQFQQFNLDQSPYEVFTLKHDPEKTDPAYYKTLFSKYGLNAGDVVYFEHSADAAKSARSVGIKTYIYDHTKQDLGALKKFLDESIGMSSDTLNPRVVVSAILEKIEDGKRYVFVQTRWKPKVSPNYLGMLEIPAGAIDGYESVYEAVRREVREETGLEIIRFIDDVQTPVMQARPGDASIAFRPFICQQVLESNGGLPWVGFVFRCEVTGTVTMQTSEAKDPRWVTVDELDELITKTPEQIFPLQLAALRYYVDTVRSE